MKCVAFFLARLCCWGPRPRLVFTHQPTRFGLRPGCAAVQRLMPAQRLCSGNSRQRLPARQHRSPSGAETMVREHQLGGSGGAPSCPTARVRHNVQARSGGHRVEGPAHTPFCHQDCTAGARASAADAAHPTQTHRRRLQFAPVQSQVSEQDRRRRAKHVCSCCMARDLSLCWADRAGARQHGRSADLPIEETNKQCACRTHDLRTMGGRP